MPRDESVRCRLTVCFEEPFWIGLYERTYDSRYEVCKITFGAEPRDAEVYQFLLTNAYRLSFSPSLEADMRPTRIVNPKRMQREARRQVQSTSLGTKAQQALKLQHEQGKESRQTRRREQREADQARRFEQRQEKKREKHKGH